MARWETLTETNWTDDSTVNFGTRHDDKVANGPTVPREDESISIDGIDAKTSESPKSRVEETPGRHHPAEWSAPALNEYGVGGYHEIWCTKKWSAMK